MIAACKFPAPRKVVAGPISYNEMHCIRPSNDANALHNVKIQLASIFFSASAYSELSACNSQSMRTSQYVVSRWSGAVAKSILGK